MTKTTMAHNVWARATRKARPKQLNIDSGEGSRAAWHPRPPCFQRHRRLAVTANVGGGGGGGSGSLARTQWSDDRQRSSARRRSASLSYNRRRIFSSAHARRHPTQSYSYDNSNQSSGGVFAP